MSKLTIKAFHIKDIGLGDTNSVNPQGKLIVCPVWLAENQYLERVEIKIAQPFERELFTHSVMDIIPISTKVLGKIGHGITHTLTGVYCVLTGVDVNGVECAEFGSSEGMFKEKVISGKAGTPSDEDFIIFFNVVFKAKMGQDRQGVYAAHRQCDLFLQEFRNNMKEFKGELCTERHDYVDKYYENRKNIVLIKQVAGQGAMYDTYLFPKEPGGAVGGMSIIDLGCMPQLLTPNEYRDGAIRSMQ